MLTFHSLTSFSDLKKSDGPYIFPFKPVTSQKTLYKGTSMKENANMKSVAAIKPTNAFLIVLFAQ